LSLFGKVNIVTFNLHSRIGPDVRASDYIDKVKNQIALFPSPSDLLGAGFRLRPFWKDFQHIIDAVEVEKNTILLILQIIVVVAIFNVLAFMIFLSEKKSQEIFLFQALGAQRRHLNRAWFVLTFFIWMASTGMSVVLVEIFDLSLQHFSFFQLPGDIYNLESLYLKLSPGHYVLVSGLAFLWMIIISSIGFYRQNRKSLLSGLRREFA
jgi:ABC-type lipoprotein release transport system permease subunit